VPTFETGRTYDRQLQIHGPTRGPGSGNSSAGITKVHGVQCIFWNPFRKLYANRWIDEPNEFIYSEGHFGDMLESRSVNANLIECEEQERQIDVFYKIASDGSIWKYLGKYLVVDHGPGSSQDDNGKWRRDLRFVVRVVDEEDASRVGILPRVKPIEPPRSPTEAELYDLLLGPGARSGHERKRRASSSRRKRVSDPLKTKYVLARVEHFGGACELCDVKPTWRANDGLPHYQAHHLNPEVDAVDWIGGICGTCHDRLHYSTDRKSASEMLRGKISERHAALGHAPTEVGPFSVMVSDWDECAEITL
jgi:hypothetical protein